MQHFKSEETAVTPIVSGLSLEISPNNSSQASSTVGYGLECCTSDEHSWFLSSSSVVSGRLVREPTEDLSEI